MKKKWVVVGIAIMGISLTAFGATAQSEIPLI